MSAAHSRMSGLEEDDSDRSRLSEAVLDGNMKEVQRLIATGADIETMDSNGDTPLSLASLRGHTSIVELLLRKGANIETRDLKGHTPLSNACLRGHREIAQLLLESDAGTETTSNKGFAPLHFAVMNRRKNAVKLLLNRGANIEIKDLGGCTPLSLACCKGYSGVVQQLLESGATIETKDGKGFSPLLLAVLNRQKDVARLLLDSGASVETRGFCGRTPLILASALGDADMIKLLLEKNARVEVEDNRDFFPLYEAVQGGHEQVVLLLLENGAQVDAHTWSSLHIALRVGHIKLANLLLEKGANISRKDKTGHIPLIFAAMHGQTDAVNLLVEHGADVDTRDNGLSALDISVIHGHVKTVEYLMKCISTERKRRVLAEQMVSVAAEHGQNDVISFLNKFVQRLNLNHIDKNGLPPLAKAVCYSHFECVKLLHSLGASWSAIGTKKRWDCISKGLSVDVYKYVLLEGLYKPVVDSVDEVEDCLCFCNEIDWSIFERILLLPGKVKSIPEDDKRVSSFPDLPGVGSVCKLNGSKLATLRQAILTKVSSLTKLACEKWAVKSPMLFGSLAELSKVGLPDEMDFRFQQEGDVSAQHLEDVGHAFRRCTAEGPRKSSTVFHSAFRKDFQVEKDDMLVSFPSSDVGGGSASTLVKMIWKGEVGSLLISVDLVPSLHVNDWPIDAIQKTWMMDRKALQEIGYELVTEAPTKSSEFGKGFADDDRLKLYTINFATLEVEHIKMLDKRVRDAYVLAKCLRDPVVCRGVVRDENGVMHYFRNYISSYLCKTVFLSNVDDFLRYQRPLIEMVYIIYSQLASYLSRGFVPSFWMPKINLLEGVDIDVAKSATVAAHLKSFLAKEYKTELKKDPPKVAEIQIPEGYAKIDMSSASGMRILRIPLEEGTTERSPLLPNKRKVPNREDDCLNKRPRLTLHETDQAPSKKARKDD